MKLFKLPLLFLAMTFMATFHVMATVPAISITSPTNGAYLHSSFTINATASDTDGSVTKVEFFLGHQLISTDYTSPYTASALNVSPGIHYITARATDNSGDSTSSSPVKVLVSNAISNVKILPSEKGTYQVDQKFNVSFNYNLTGNDVYIHVVPVLTGAPLYSGPFTYSPSPVYSAGFGSVERKFSITGYAHMSALYFQIQRASDGVTLYEDYYPTDLMFINSCINSYEPNNTLQTAAEFPINEEFNGSIFPAHYAAISSSTDQDYYKFYAHKNSVHSIKLNQLVKDYDIQLLDSNGTVIAYSLRGGALSEEINYTFTKEGYYYIRIYGYAGNHGDNCYQLSNSPVCGQNLEPNDTKTMATTLNLNNSSKKIIASIDTPGDIDNFSFQSEKTGWFSGTVYSHASNQDFELRVIDALTDQIVVSSENAGTLRETIEFYTRKNTLYIVQVYTRNNTASSYCYNFDYNFTTGDCIDNEDNESLVSATPINQTGVINYYMGAKIISNIDTDWYSFSTLASATNINIGLSDLVRDFDIRLYDYSGKLLKTSQNGSTNNEKIIYNTSLPGTYYIKVYGYNGYYSDSCYSLSVNTNNTPYARLVSESAATNYGKESESDHIQLYPNPVKSGQSIQLEIPTVSDKETRLIKVMDLNSKVMLEKTINIINGHSELHLGDLQTGIYLIDAGEGMIQRLIIQ